LRGIITHNLEQLAQDCSAGKIELDESYFGGVCKGRRGPRAAKSSDARGRQTALHLAARADHLEILERLLRIPGINVNAEDSNGKTALHIAEEKGHARSMATLRHQRVVNTTRP